LGTTKILCLVLLLVLLTGCTNMSKYICVEHSDLEINKTIDGNWKLEKGMFEMKLNIGSDQCVSGEESFEEQQERINKQVNYEKER